jgi:hypothetical protein
MTDGRGWVGHHLHDPALFDTYRDLEHLAEWSEWAPFSTALPYAPREPGVYLFREPATQLIRYAGMAGERSGNGNQRPQGLYGRLSVYRTGKGAVSGFGEAALDRALADPDWVAGQLERLRTVGPRRAKEWAADAIARIGPDVSWATCPERADAQFLEVQVLQLLRPHGLWDRGNVRDQ